MVELSAEQFAQRAFDLNLLDERQFQDVMAQIGSRQLSGAEFHYLSDRCWPVRDTRHGACNVRCRGIPAVGDARLNGSNGSGTAARSSAMSGGSTIYTGRSRLDGRCALCSGRSYRNGGSL